MATATIKPLTPERAEELRRILQQADNSRQALLFRPNGEVAGTARVSDVSPDDRTAVIGKYGTHY